jgi:hypothetical protein
MIYKIPTSFMGRDSKEAYEKIMNEKAPEEKASPIIPSSAGKDLEGFIYVSSINLYVAKERKYFGKNANECTELLHSNNERMPAIPEFVEFLKYCKIHHQNIYNEIAGVRKTYSAEWLDTDFKMKGKDLYINSYLFDASGNIIQKSELLDRNTLMEDKTPGISLEDFLDNNHTSQGLPNKKIQSGDLYYWHPRGDNNSVARFSTGSSGADLDCSKGPSIDVFALGVRAVRRA